MKINLDFISDVKSKLDIVDVIGAYINLQKAGHSCLDHIPSASERT